MFVKKSCIFVSLHILLFTFWDQAVTLCDDFDIKSKWFCYEFCYIYIFLCLCFYVKNITLTKTPPPFFSPRICIELILYGGEYFSHFADSNICLSTQKVNISLQENGFYNQCILFLTFVERKTVCSVYVYICLPCSYNLTIAIGKHFTKIIF